MQKSIKQTAVLKMGKDLNKHLAKEDTQIINKCTKIWSTSYTIRELHMKTIRQHYTHIRTANLLPKGQHQLLEDGPKQQLAFIADGTQIWPLEIQFGSIFQSQTSLTPWDPSLCLQYSQNCFEKLYPNEKRTILCTEALLIMSKSSRNQGFFRRWMHKEIGVHTCEGETRTPQTMEFQ